MNRNRLLILQARTKIFALQHAGKAIVRTEPNNVFSRHFAEPFAVVANFSFFAVEDFEDLSEVGLGIRINLLSGQRWAGFGLSRWVTNHRRKVANQENRGVAEVLKMLELSNDDRVAEMNVGRSRVHAEIHAQGFSGLLRFVELGSQ